MTDCCDTGRCVGPRYFGPHRATDEDWASPAFDYLQPYISRLLDPTYPVAGGRAWAEAEAQRWRCRRPYLIAHVRRSIGDPKWDPRGARVRTLTARATLCGHGIPHNVCKEKHE